MKGKHLNAGLLAYLVLSALVNWNSVRFRIREGYIHLYLSGKHP